MEEALTWKGLVTIRGRAREVELTFYPERGCWQLFERRGDRLVRIGVRGLVTEVLSIAMADLLCQATGRRGARPHPFEESFSTRYQALLKQSRKWLKRTNGDLLTPAERKKYRHVLDELQGYEAREDKWQGSGSLMTHLAEHQQNILRGLEELTARLQKRAAKAGKVADQPFPFGMFALRRGEPGAQTWLVGDSPEDLDSWEPSMWKAKLFRALSTAHEQKVGFLKVRPECGPVEVVELKVTMGNVAA